MKLNLLLYCRRSSESSASLCSGVDSSVADLLSEGEGFVFDGLPACEVSARYAGGELTLGGPLADPRSRREGDRGLLDGGGVRTVLTICL
jgi:hypothetical protein